MPALIGPIGTVVNMNQAVNGNALGNPAYASQLLVAEAVGGQAQIIANYNAQLASSVAATLATTVMNNLFITTAAGVPAANVTALTAALTQAFQTYPTAKGQVINNLTNLLGGLESDPNWGPAARAFNSQAAADYTYSINPANTNAGTPSTTTTFTLTVNADGPGAVAPAANTQGGSGNDQYNGTIAAAAANGDSGTLNSFDNLAGGTGTDTLIARITALGGATTISPVMSSVEVINVGSVDTSGFVGTLNLTGATGVTNVGFLNTVAASATNIINAPTTAAITLDNADSTVNQRVNLGPATGRTGTADAFAVTFQNGSGASTAVADFGLITNAAAADASFEVMNVTVGAGAANFINFSTGGANITTVNVSGAGTPSTATTTTGQVLILTEAGNFANVETINASGLTTGGLNISTTLAENVTFTGSSFNDRLNVTGGVGNITGNDVINFGTGTLDTLAIGTTVDFRAATLGAPTTALINAITTADALEATAAGAVQIRMADWTTINTFILSGATGAAGAVASTNNAAITGLQTADTLRVQADIRTIGAAGAAGATGGANAGTAGTAGVDNILLGGQAVGQTANLVFTGGIDLVANGGAGGAGGASTSAGATGGAGAAGGAGASAIDVANGGANIATLNIASIGTTANTLLGGSGGAGGNGGAANTANGQGGAAGAGGNGAAAIDNGAGLTQVNITGNADLTIAGGTGGAAGTVGAGQSAGATAAAGTNAGGFSGAVNVNASTFTGVLTITGSTAADAITAGSNNDVITTFGGLDSLTGGAGTDDFRINGSAATTATAYVTIQDFASGDQISVLSQVAAAAAPNGTATFNATAVNVSTAANLAGALDLAAAGAGNVNSVVRWFNWTDGNTYLVVDNSANATLQAGDGVIQLVGTVTLTVGSVDFA